MKKLDFNLWYLVSYFVLIGSMIFVHTFRLGDIPYGINVDEMGMGYDSWCLAHFGVDRYLNSFPLYLINFSGGQSSLYAYLCIPFIKLLGLNVVAMRIPAVIFGFLTAFYGYRLTRLIWPEKREYHLLFIFFYTVFPVFTMLHRIGLDCNLSLGATTLFLFCFVRAIQSEKMKDFIVSGFACGLVLYAYALNYFLIPLFLILTLCYLVWIKKINLKNVVVFAIPLIILGMPLFLIQVINILDLEKIKIGIFTLPRLYRYRGEDFAVSSILKNLLGTWNSIFLHDGVLFNSIPGFYTMYVLTIPLALIGIVKGFCVSVSALKRKVFEPVLLLLLVLVIEILLGCVLNTDGPNTYRLNSVFIIMVLFTIQGCDTIRSRIEKRGKKWVVSATVILVTGYSVFFGFFVTYYFSSYQEDTYLIPLFQHKFEEALEYIETEVPPEVAQRVTYIGDLNQTYIYYLGSTLLSPYQYNQLEVEDNQHLWEWAANYNNFDFNLPEQIRIHSNYIVVDTNQEYCKRLDELGFTSIKKGHYYVYTHPWKEYQHSNNMAYGWDLGITENGTISLSTGLTEVEGEQCVVIVGWNFNGTKEKQWDDLFIQAGSKVYYPELTDRPDIAERFGNSAIAKCGMVYVIPVKELEEADEIRMVGIDIENKEKSEVWFMAID